MVRQQIIEEIRRIAEESDGQAPGRQLFERSTGIKKTEWYPHVWVRWGDALAEAGYAPNQLAARFDDEVIIVKFIDLIRQLGRFPVEGEIRRKAREDSSFPSHSTFNRFGGRQKLIEGVAAHCRKTAGFEDILALCAADESKSQVKTTSTEPSRNIAIGFVYLMKSGPHYKIGRTNSVDRRSNELTIKIPVPPKTVHSIATDDPSGVEAYWHRRFSDKRGEGEWFLLTTDDVIAFKRWKRIV
jgi:hypothetical protein